MFGATVPLTVSQAPTFAEAEGLSHEALLAVYAEAFVELEQLRALQAEHIRARVSLELSTHALRERVKELNCLYSISAIAERPSLSLDDAIQQIVELLPIAWQYPEVACSRIVINEKAYQSPTYAPFGEFQSQAVTVGGEGIGLVELRYLEPRPPSFEGPFLAEERSLINAIAGRIGEMVEQRRARAAIVASLEKNRALLAAIPDLIVQLRHDGVLLDYHVGDYGEFDECLRAMVGRDLGELFEAPGLFVRLDGIEDGRPDGLGRSPQILQRKVTLAGKRHDFEIRLVETSDRNTLGILRDITQRNRLEHEILEVSGREQRRIGRELHDGLCQHLAGIGFLAQALAQRVPQSEPVLAQDAGELANLIGEAISLAKGLTRGLIPARLENDGLAPALHELTNTATKLFGVDCRVEEPFGLTSPDSSTLLHLYRIAQEALNNAIKHGRPTEVTISIAEELPWACLTIKDNGKGFSVEKCADSGLGLGIMRYRALMLGGTLSVQSDSHGTFVLCRFPAANMVRDPT
jgi:signal transduction histidine kinase